MLQALVTLGLAAVVAGQPRARAALPVQSPYLDAVRHYGPGTERQAIAALNALRLRNADQVFAELDDRVCTAAGAFSCTPVSLVRAGIEARERVAATWRQLYPRALGLHVEALASTERVRDARALDVHRNVLLRMFTRLEEIAREPDVPDDFVQLAMRGRRLLVWVLQLLRHEPALALTMSWFDEAKVKVHDRELALARGALAELRATPGAVRASSRLAGLDTPQPREARIAAEEARRLAAAVRAYESALADYPDTLEAHLRLARLLLRQGRPDAAVAHLQRVAALDPDGRQAYLMHLFLADVHERRGDRVGALAAYASAQRAWPAAQSPAIAAARLHALAGDATAAGNVLARVHAERDRRERSDPWHGYTGAQAWKLPGGIAALQAIFEPLR